MAALAAGKPAAADAYYFRGATFFEAAVARYAWLTSHIVVCCGHREPAQVNVSFYKVA
jgi:hypothetical protein